VGAEDGSGGGNSENTGNLFQDGIADRVVRGEKDYEPGEGETGVERSWPQKAKDNLAAIRLLKTLDEEGRAATPEEQATLALYVGWGAMKGAFDWHMGQMVDGNGDLKYPYAKDDIKNWVRQWGKTNAELKRLMTQTEWEEAAASSLNAHYTRECVVDELWNAAIHLGWQGGLVVEPGCGIGKVISRRPKNTKEPVTIVGIEKDPISAAIAKHLYPSQKIINLPLQRAEMPTNMATLAIGNVPFHQVGPYDPEYADAPKLNLHNFCIAKSLDRLTPGAGAILITSRHTMDSSRQQREYLASKADLIGAVRLPMEVFKQSAGTETTMDVLFLRKRAIGEDRQGESWLGVEALQDEAGNYLLKPGAEKDNPSDRVYINEYFIRHPEKVLGRVTFASNGYVEDYAVTSDDPSPEGVAQVMQQFRAQVGTFPQDILTAEKMGTDFMVTDRDDEQRRKEGCYFFDAENNLKQFQSGRAVDPDWLGAGAKRDESNIRVAQDWIKVRDALRHLVTAETGGAGDEDLTILRGALNQSYTRFLAKHGPLNRPRSPARILADDPDYPLVLGLEEMVENPKTGQVEAVKADIFTKRIVEATKRDDPFVYDVNDAVNVSLGLKGKIDLDYIEARLRLPTEPDLPLEDLLLETGRVFEDPVTGEFQIAAVYLSGNVVKKHRIAVAAAAKEKRYEENVKALAAVLPQRLSVDQIGFGMNSPWMPPEILNDFLSKTLGGRVYVTKDAAGQVISFNTSDVKYSPSNTREWSAGGFKGDEIAKMSMKGVEVTAYKNIDLGQGKKKAIVDEDNTILARDMQKKMEEAFSQWVKTTETPCSWDEAKRTPGQIVESQYNETINVLAPIETNYDYLLRPEAFPGLTDIVYKTPHRMAALARFLQEPAGVIAHNVSGGKTFTLIMLAMKMKQLGQAKKPLIVVQNSTVEQFAISFRKAYPNARVLVPSAEDFSAKKRQKLLARAAYGDWDCVILTHSQLSLLSCSPEAVKSYYQTRISDLKDSLEICKENAKGDRSSVRALQSSILALERKLAQTLDRLKKRQDRNIYFEQLGIDAILVDEVHAFKRYPLSTTHQRVKGVPADFSQRAMNFAIMCESIQSKRNGKFIIGATGTPVTNTMAEAWVMLRLMAPNVLKESGMTHFDSFLGTYTKVEKRTEFTWSNSFKEVSRLAKFINGPEFVRMIRTGMDIKIGAAKIGLDIPELKGGRPTAKTIELTPPLHTVIKTVMRVANKFNKLTGEEKKRFSWVPIVTMGVGSAAALDPRLVDPSLEDHPESKINQAIRDINDLLKEGEEHKRTILVFMDRFNPVKTEKLNAFLGRKEGEVIEIETETERDEPSEEENSPDVDITDETTPSNIETVPDENGFNLAREIKAKLVALGHNPSSIAIANETPKEQRAKLFDDVNSGNVRVIIGSTEVMGVGVNVQERAMALIELDRPRAMTPAMQEQRFGRILRTGNKFKHLGVTINQYGAKYSMDAAILQLLEYKTKFILQVLSEDVEREFDDPCDEVMFSLQDQIAALTGDNRLIEKTKLEGEIRVLENRKRAVEKSRLTTEMQIRSDERSIKYMQEQHIPHLEKAEKTAAYFDIESDNYELIMPGGESRTGRKAIEGAVDVTFARAEKVLREQNKDEHRVTVTLNQVPIELIAKRVGFSRGAFEYAYAVKDDEDKTLFGADCTNASGMIQSLMGSSKRMKQKLVQVKTELENTQKTLAMSKASVDKGFDEEALLNEKRAKLAALKEDLVINPSEIGEDENITKDQREPAVWEPSMA
jgi:N12 class adenine-specific DNA methylase